jgi:hypothetical protein
MIPWPFLFKQITSTTVSHEKIHLQYLKTLYIMKNLTHFHTYMPCTSPWSLSMNSIRIFTFKHIFTIFNITQVQNNHQSNYTLNIHWFLNVLWVLNLVFSTWEGGWGSRNRPFFLLIIRNLLNSCHLKLRINYFYTNMDITITLIV